MIYFVLFLHYGFYIFFVMLFASFIFTATNNNKIKKLSVFYLTLYSVIEFLLISAFLFNGMYEVVWGIIILSLMIAIISTFVLRLFIKIDFSIWLPFSILFSPLIVIPSFVFLIIFYKKYSISK
ncbi:MAG: hypothetical protein GY756_14900 [bacterium]|nr:hypothetical protein [bacterium]